MPKFFYIFLVIMVGLVIGQKVPAIFQSALLVAYLKYTILLRFISATTADNQHNHQEINIASSYDSSDEWLSSLQHIAREGYCWVVGCGNLMQVKDIAEDFQQRDRLYPNTDKWINPGDSIVIAPDGRVEAGPLRQRTAFCIIQLMLKKVGIAKRAMDVTGHYSRPDIFTLPVNKVP